MYQWRKMSEKQRLQILSSRRQHMHPWHSPPHFQSDGMQNFHVTAACYEHSPILGSTPERMKAFEFALVELLNSADRTLHAWCILPSHWHALVLIADLKGMIADIGRLHGKTSFEWNGADGMRGRQCWCRCADRRIRSERHFFVTRNYIHNNAVKHGYVDKWEDWPFSSANAYIADKGREAILTEWNECPVLDMGVGWDD